MAEDARHDSIHPKRKIPRQVRNGFSFAQAAFRLSQEDGPAAKLANGHFKGDARSEGRLFEDQCDMFSRQRLAEAPLPLRSRTEEQRRKVRACELPQRKHICILMHSPA